MAVCVGITYNGSRILVQYNASDGSKGVYPGSDPYTLQDIYDTDQNGAWGAMAKLGNHYELTGYLEITGLDTYMEFDSETLKTTSDYIYNIYSHDVGYVYAIRTLFQMGQQAKYFYFRGKCQFSWCTWNTYRQYLYFIGQGIDNKCHLTWCTFLHVFTVYANEYVFIDRCFSAITTYPFSPDWGAEYDGYTIEDPFYAFYTNRLSGTGGPLTLRNIRIFNSDNGILYQLGDNVLGTVNFVDSNIDYTDYQLYVGIGELWLNHKTTFNATVKYGDGGVLIIKDKDGNIVYQETLSGESMTEQEVTFASHHVRAIVYSVFDIDDLQVMEPFQLEVTKNGYNKLIIPDIAITGGETTNVFAQMNLIVASETILPEVEIDEEPTTIALIETETE